jgi:hypothetical protein
MPLGSVKIGLDFARDFAQPSESNLVLPSLLGRDILQYYRLVCDGRTREVFLERDER